MKRGGESSAGEPSLQDAAHGLGPGSRWSQMKGNNFKEGTTSTQYIAELLGLPENLTVHYIIAIESPGEEMVPYKKDELRFDKVSYSRYGRKMV